MALEKVKKFCGVRYAKIKNNLTQKEQHNERSGFYGANVKDEFSCNNQVYKTQGYTTVNDIYKRNLAEYKKTHKKAIRKDHVKVIDCVLYTSAGRIQTEEQKRAYFEACKDFARMKFKGQDYAIYYHLDEKEPHCHVLVNMGKGGIFNANPFVGTGEILSADQDFFEKCCKKYGLDLERGVKGSKAPHQDIKKYYTQKAKEDYKEALAQYEQDKKDIYRNRDEAIARINAEADSKIKEAEKKAKNRLRELGLEGYDVINTDIVK